MIKLFNKKKKLATIREDLTDREIAILKVIKICTDVGIPCLWNKKDNLELELK